MATPVKLPMSTTKVVNGATVPDYATEATNNNTTIGKMINVATAMLKAQKVKGTGGVVGTYDQTLLGDACYAIWDGAQHADSGYGVILTRNQFENAKVFG